MMAIDALELSVEMRPDVVILVTGDADFAYSQPNYGGAGFAWKWLQSRKISATC